MFPVGSQVSSTVIFFHLFSNWTQGHIENESVAMAPTVTVVQGRGNTELGPTGHLGFSLNKTPLLDTHLWTFTFLSAFQANDQGCQLFTQEERLLRVRWLNTSFCQSHPGLLFGLKDYVSFLLCKMPITLTHLHVGFESCVYFSVTTRESSFNYCHTWTWKLAHPCQDIPLTACTKNKMTIKTFLVFYPSLDFYSEHLRMVILSNKWFT